MMSAFLLRMTAATQGQDSQTFFSIFNIYIVQHFSTKKNLYSIDSLTLGNAL
jgi:hypothetical protein